MDARRRGCGAPGNLVHRLRALLTPASGCLSGDARPLRLDAPLSPRCVVCSAACSLLQQIPTVTGKRSRDHIWNLRIRILGKRKTKQAHLIFFLLLLAVFFFFFKSSGERGLIVPGWFIFLHPERLSRQSWLPADYLALFIVLSSIFEGSTCICWFEICSFIPVSTSNPLPFVSPTYVLGPVQPVSLSSRVHVRLVLAEFP